MPKYIAHRDTWLSHESRKVLAGEEFSTTFPEVKVDGKLVPMRLGENIELVAEQKPEGNKSRSKPADDLV